MYVEELECKLEQYQRKYGDIEPETTPSSGRVADNLNLEGSKVRMSDQESNWRTSTSDGHLNMFGGSGGMELSVREKKERVPSLDDGEPTAKKFYARERTSWIEPSTSAQSTGFKTWRTRVSSDPADPGLDNPGSSETEHFSSKIPSDSSKERDYQQGGQEPITGHRSPKTPSSVFKSLRVGSGTKEEGLSLSTLDNPCVHSQRLPKGPSPRRQLNFVGEEQDSDQAHHQHRQSDGERSSANLVAGSTGTDNQQTLNHGSSSSGTKENNEFIRKQDYRDMQHSFYSRNFGDTHNETLNELDISLTPEFVDCARLMKAAEQRVKQRSRSSENEVTDSVGQSSASGLTGRQISQN